MIKFIVYFFAFVFSLGAGAVGTSIYLNTRSDQPSVLSEQVTPTIAVRPTFAFQLPKDALVGDVATASGDIKKHARDSKTPTEMADIHTGDKIYTGERITTGETGEGIVTFSDAFTMHEYPKSSAGFVSLLPGKYLVSHTQGKVEYTPLKKGTEISIRNRAVLYTFYDGECTVDIDPDTGELLLSNADAHGKIAIIDNDNQTQTYTLEPHKTARIDSDAATVKIK